MRKSRPCFFIVIRSRPLLPTVFIPADAAQAREDTDTRMYVDRWTRASLSLSPHGLALFHHFLSGPWRRIATPVDGCMPGWRFRPAARSAASIRCRAPPLVNFPGVGSLRLTGTAAGLWRHRGRVSRIRFGHAVHGRYIYTIPT